MKFLLDSCVSGQLKQALTAAGHDVEWCGEWPQDPGDGTILTFAHEHRRILLTLDKDFGELAILKGTPHSGIIRIADMGLTEQAPAILEIIRRHGTELERGAIVTAAPGRLRIRISD